MDSRFTFKDFVFLVLFVFMIVAVFLVSRQINYNEERLSGVRDEVAQLNKSQQQQLTVLSDIRHALQGGVQISAANGNGGAAGSGTSGTQPDGGGGGTGGNIRRKNPDGSIYVYYPAPPPSPRHPELNADYATGDWLMQNVGMEPELIAPLIEKDMSGQMAHGPVLESLVALNPETVQFDPLLADWYEESADGMHLKFHLRPQVCFSDGVAMTADDVLFSFNTMMNPDLDDAPLRGYYDRVKSCHKIDDRTIEFEMTAPYFLAMDFVGGLTIIPEHIYKFAKGEDYNKRGDLLVGSGPYRVLKWDRGQKLTFVRNEKYWGDRPTYDRIVYQFIGNAQAQLQSFLNGQLDYLGEPIEPDPELYLKYTADEDFLKKNIAYKYARPQAMYMYIGYNCDKPMFKDKETRQALTMLIDRRAIIDQMLKGFGTEMTGPFHVGSPQNDTTIKPFPYDPEEAKKKLAAAGWKAGDDGVLARDGVRFEFELSMRSGVPLRDRIGTYVQQQFQQAGIRMKLTPYEPSVLIERLDERKFDVCLAGWGAGSIEEDPKQIWSSKSIEDRGSNHVAFRNAEADKLIEEGEITVDTDKRMEIWHKFQKIVYDEQPYTWLYSEIDCAFINGRFRNTQPYRLGLSELDWYVPASLQKYR